MSLCFIFNFINGYYNESACEGLEEFASKEGEGSLSLVYKLWYCYLGIELISFGLKLTFKLLILWVEFVYRELLYPLVNWDNLGLPYVWSNPYLIAKRGGKFFWF